MNYLTREIRTKLLGVRLLPHEHAALRLAAEERGVSVSELVVDTIRRTIPDVIDEWRPPLPGDTAHRPPAALAGRR